MVSILATQMLRAARSFSSSSSSSSSTSSATTSATTSTPITTSASTPMMLFLDPPALAAAVFANAPPALRSYGEQQ